MLAELKIYDPCNIFYSCHHRVPNVRLPLSTKFTLNWSGASMFQTFCTPCILTEFNHKLFYSHEVSEAAGFLTYAFGTDGLDRYVRVYRKENAPCEDELAARRRGDPWSAQIKQQLVEKVSFIGCNASANVTTDPIFRESETRRNIRKRSVVNQLNSFLIQIIKTNMPI